jgi:hypothetical protein
MGHRDDHEAARARIDALERELAETKARAEQELAEARAQAARSERGRRSAPSAPSEPPDPRWSDRLRRGYLRSVMLAVAVVDALVVLRFVLWPIDESAPEHVLGPMLVGWALAPFVLLPACYVLARIARAPHPGSVFGVGMIASMFGVMGVFGAMGVGWPEALAVPPWRWVAQLGLGLVTIVVHAAALGHWTAEAVLSEDTGSD